MMSEKAASKHNQAKEQRKPRSTRSGRDANHHQSKYEKDIGEEKKEDVSNTTETSDTKYCKKEIDNNWNKYETKMETYEQFEKKENLGANYEELSKMPLSGGNHFQFKHEKIDYVNTPTDYDKYFQCNIDILSAAMLSLPFLERNSLDKTIFRTGEIENMIHRSNKFADKYKNMIKRAIEVVVNADDNSKLSDTSESRDDLSKESSFGRTEISDAVIVKVVKSETSKSTSETGKSISETSKTTLLKMYSSPTPDLDVDQQNKIDKDVEKSIFAETISSTEIDMIASPKMVNENSQPKSTEDLEKWLDDFLEG